VITGTIDDCVIANEDTDWGRLKTLYR